MSPNTVTFPDCDVDIIDLTDETPPTSPSDNEEADPAEANNVDRTKVTALMSKCGRTSVVRVSGWFGASLKGS